MAFDPQSPYAKKVLAELEQPRTRAMLLKIAAWRTGQPATAQDLVQDALVVVLDESGDPWVDPRWTFLSHMTFVIKHVWHEQRRPKAVRSEVIDDDLARDENTVSQQPRPDAETYRHQQLAVQRELGRRLLADLGDSHPRARQVFDLACEGIDEAAEQALALGCPVEEIYRARELLTERGQKVLARWEVEDGQRRFERRQVARAGQVARAVAQEDER